MSGPRVLTIDIETSPNLVWTWGLFNQNISINQIKEPTRMLSFAAKWYGDKEVIFRSEYHDGPGPMRDSLHGLLDEADVVVHFNGTTFDVPHIQRELYLGNYSPPSPFKQIDLIHTARKQFRFTSNKLDYLLQQSGLGHKVHHQGFPLWIGCMEGDAKAWAQMKRYNIGDTIKEEKLYTRIRPWIRNHPNLQLFVDDDSPACPTCLSKRLAKDGKAHTALGTYQRYVCGKCGKYSRGKKATRTIDIRGV